ncbi:MAG: orotidine-5'-phosphate decarboxylase [Geminicoccaceae bacterium]
MTQDSPVFCAIDRPDLKGALALGESLVDAVGGLKVGLEFITANGPVGIRKIVDLGLPVFLDVKFHDIPNTVHGAIRAVGDLGVAMLTLHLSGGPAMLEAAVAAAKAIEGRRPWLLGVSVLTSMDDHDLEAVGVRDKTEDQVLRLAELARASGLDGMICSPKEIAPLKQRFGDSLKLVVPGIRPKGSAAGDQKRTLTPADAIEAGADLLVIGRPITEAPDPRAAALTIQAEIDAARKAA